MRGTVNRPLSGDSLAFHLKLNRTRFVRMVALHQPCAIQTLRNKGQLRQSFAAAFHYLLKFRLPEIASLLH